MVSAIWGIVINQTPFQPRTATGGNRWSSQACDGNPGMNLCHHSDVAWMTGSTPAQPNGCCLPSAIGGSLSCHHPQTRESLGLVHPPTLTLPGGLVAKRKCPLWMERAQVWGERHNGKGMLNILNRKLISTGQKSRENFGSLGGLFTSAFHLGSARINKQTNAHS